MESAVENARVTEPALCSNSACLSKNMSIMHSRCVFYDRQIIRVQETPDSVPDGQTPQTVNVVAYDELVDAAKPGDRVEITGIYKAMAVRLNPRQRAAHSIFRTFIDALHFKSTDKKRLGSTILNALEGDESRIE